MTGPFTDALHFGNRNSGQILWVGHGRVPAEDCICSVGHSMKPCLGFGAAYSIYVTDWAQFLALQWPWSIVKIKRISR